MYEYTSDDIQRLLGNLLPNNMQSFQAQDPQFAQGFLGGSQQLQDLAQGNSGVATNLAMVEMPLRQD